MTFLEEFINSFEEKMQELNENHEYERSVDIEECNAIISDEDIKAFLNFFLEEKENDLADDIGIKAFGLTCDKYANELDLFRLAIRFLKEYDDMCCSPSCLDDIEETMECLKNDPLTALKFLLNFE